MQCGNMFFIQKDEMSSFIHITSAFKVPELPTLELLKSTELSAKPSNLYLSEYHVRNEFKAKEERSLRY
jgi:hypothetical protein